MGGAGGVVLGLSSSPSSSLSSNLCSSPSCSVCCWLGGGVHMLPAPLPTGDCLLSVLQVCSAPQRHTGLVPPRPSAGPWLVETTAHCALPHQHPASSHQPLPTLPTLPSPAHVMRAARSWSQCGLRRAVPHTAFTIYSADCCVF